ncbi:MAG: DUF4091 domain-containing protein [Clostridia bacterium]|nr:DUF4091 domain-containing protein [Clostridia bacterium]
MFKSVVLTSMAKVMPYNNIDALYSQSEFSCLKGERLCFQIALQSDSDESVKFSISDETNLKAYEVGYTPASYPADERADFYYITKMPGLFPDVLNEKKSREISLSGGKPTALFFEFKSDFAGEKEIDFTFTNGKESASHTVKIDVINAELPEDDFICTHWFHTDCLCDWYSFEPFTEDYWKCVENYTKTAVEHGINSLLIPLFTPPLDTEIGKERKTIQLVDVTVTESGYVFGFEKLKKWIALFKKCGIKAYEFSHFFTQWGALHAPKIMALVNGEYKRIFGWETDSTGEEYVSFLTAFSKALKPVLKECEIEDCSYFHISDEPGEDDIEQYEKCSKIVNSLFGEYKIIDALSEFDFYKKGIVKHPIPVISDAIDFVGNVPDLWIYYCCGPVDGNYSNRFLAMPSQRTRILGMQMYKYNIKGFLHWGYNFWYTQLSKAKINPYEVSDGGNAFSGGDPCVVYPGENLSPVCSLRLKVFYDALQDMRALLALEKLAGREEAVKILESDGEITFNQYPHSEKWHFEKRMAINNAIKQLTKN